jgi:alcohol dehydrogenase class IV
MAADAIASGSPDNNPRKPSHEEVADLYMTVYDDVLEAYQ